MEKYIITLVILAYILTPIIANNNDNGAINALKINDLENIKIQNYTLFGCGNDDIYRKSFTATKNGNVVTGHVCGGVLKGYTVRY